MRRWVALAVGCTMVACGSSSPKGLEFGVRRLALDIAFVDESVAPAAKPEVIVRIVPAPPEVLEPGFDFSDVEDRPEKPFVPPSLDDVEVCPAAPDGATIALPVAPQVLDPPKPGRYLRVNSGSITLTGAGVPLKFGFPVATTWVVSPAKEVTPPGLLGLPGTAPPQREFTITKSLGPTYEITETFAITATALTLVERKSVVSGVTTTFRTDPPVEFFRYGAVGDTWNSAGADQANGFGVVIQGSIEDKEVVDVCGELVETFLVNYTEQVVNLRNGEVNGTDSAGPSFLRIAPQYGGLVVQENLKTLQRTSDPDGNPVVIQFDYESRQIGVDPQ